MKTIGILGGMSPASTALYYDRLNAGVRARLGGAHSAELILRSLDFGAIQAMQEAGAWDAAGRLLADEALRLERAGAQMVLLATNTMHKVADPVIAALSVPFLHIGDATAAAVRAAGHRRPGLMATAYTMEQRFYIDRLRGYGLEPVLPEAADRAETHRIIFAELVHNVVTAESRAAYEAIAGRLADAGADCLILGCTEVGMLLDAGNCPLPVFDTTAIHCDTAIALSLEDT